MNLFGKSVLMTALMAMLFWSVGGCTAGRHGTAPKPEFEPQTVPMVVVYEPTAEDLEFMKKDDPVLVTMVSGTQFEGKFVTYSSDGKTLVLGEVESGETESSEFGQSGRQARIQMEKIASLTIEKKDPNKVLTGIVVVVPMILFLIGVALHNAFGDYN